MHRPLGEALRDIAQEFSALGIDAPWREARLLAAHVLAQPYSWVFAHPEYSLTKDQDQHLKALVARRCAHEPLAKIIQQKEFWGLPFKTTRDTLDPRPDSETLIEKMLEDHPDRSLPYRILDLGTGTGCLLIAALSELPNSTGVGVDISDAALDVARENAIALGCSDRIDFVRSNWTEGLSGTFDIVLTNPPYIGEEESLPPEVKLFEPPQALYASNSGLGDYEAIAISLKNALKLNGLVYVELGFNQANDVARIFENHNFFLMGIKKDLGGVDRCATFAYQVCI